MKPLRRLQLALVVSSLACASPLSVEVAPDIGGMAVRTLALVPLEAGSEPAAGQSSGGVEARVTARLLEELILVGFEVIPPREVSLALTSARSSPGRLSSAELARILSSKFRVDALVTGRVLRNRARRGGPRGAIRSASVWFTVQVYDLEGRILWRGDYDETQASVASRLGRFRLALSRNFEWLTADQLVRFGSREIAGRMRRDLGKWK